ncbi:MAG TPA: hypothetical protein VJC16_01255 [Candidatus Nanoarchaeia archaeon]|nr:hypothetical protein [Candidatus Nanoarchaeia archaeon]
MKQIVNEDGICGCGKHTDQCCDHCLAFVCDEHERRSYFEHQSIKSKVFCPRCIA